jgi:hypothetical protein
MWLAGETEVLGENIPQRNFVHHKSHLPDPGANPGCRGGKPATNRLSYGAANQLRYRVPPLIKKHLDFSVGELKSVFPVTNYLKQISL